MPLLSHQKPVLAALTKHFRSREKTKFGEMEIHPPIIVSASVSSGKSVILAETAKAVKEAALSRSTPVTVNVAIIQRQGILAEQNFAAAWSIGLHCSMFSASCGNRKSTHYSVITATEGTLARALDQYRFTPYTPEEMQLPPDQRAQLGKWHPDLILIDEVHQVGFEDPNTQYMRVLMHFYKCKPHMRLAGMTGSPFRGSSSIVGDTDAHLWKKVACISSDDPEYPEGGIGDGVISTEFMVDQGWVVPPIFGYPDSNEAHYDFSHIEPNDWSYDEAALDEAVSDRETCLAICADIVEKTKARRGVLIFASTKRHTKQIAAALKILGVADNQIGVITEDTSNKEQARILDLAKAGKMKFVINVSVLTTGVSVPEWDVCVFLRPIASIVLLIQSIGRVLRLLIKDGDVPMLERDGLTAEERRLLIQASDKPDALILDYANVMATLGALYDNPVLEQADLEKAKKDGKDLILCHECGTMNSPHARRCIGRDHYGNRCEHFWHFRLCPSCNTKNDQVARECRNSECRRMLIDPNANLERKHYTSAEAVPNRAMSIEAGRGGKLAIRFSLSDGRTPEIFFWPHAGKQPALNTRIWKGFVKQLPIPDRDKFRLGSMKASTIMQNLELIPVPVELCARQNAKGVWNIGGMKWADQSENGGEVVL